MTTRVPFPWLGVLLRLALFSAGGDAGGAPAPAGPQGVITAQEYRRIEGTAVSNLTGSPRFPDSPDLTAYAGYCEWPQAVPPAIQTRPPSDVRNDYGVRIVGYFYPETSRDHTFYLCADDQAVLYLGTGADPGTKRQIAREPVWGAVRDYTGTARRPNRENISSPIPLVAGQAYYFEALMKEGGGGDNLSVSIDGLQPIPGARLASFDKASGPVVVVDPPASQTIPVGSRVTLEVTVDGTPPYSYQWSRNEVPIAGATEATYRVAAVTAADDGARFRVAITGPTGAVTSPDATLTVLADTAPPAVLRAYRGADLASLTLLFDEPIEEASATVAGHYAIDPPVAVGQATLLGDRAVRLSTGPLTDGQIYTVSVGGLADRAAPPNSMTVPTATEVGLALFTPATVQWERWTGDTPIGTFVSALTGGTLGPPPIRWTTTGFESGRNLADGYRARGSAWFVPSATGEYTFVVTADDHARVFVATDSDPAHRNAVAAEWGISGARFWSRATDEQVSDTYLRMSDPLGLEIWPGRAVTLQAGQPYSLEVLWRDGTGGDGCELTILRAGEPLPPEGTAPSTSGGLLGILVEPGPRIVWPPLARNASAGGAATFAVTATGRPPLHYRWLKDEEPLTEGAAFAGTSTATLTVSDLREREEGVYSVTVSNAEGSVTSLGARLTVADPAIAIQPVSRNRSPGESVAFEVVPVGTGPFAYQWFRDGNPLENRTGASWTLDTLGKDDAGRYTVRVTNAFGSADSLPAALTVNVVGAEADFDARVDRIGTDAVLALAEQPDGRWLVGGDFSIQDGAFSSRKDLVRLLPDGTVDSTFLAEVSGPVTCLAVQSDGRMVLAGNIAGVNGHPRERLARVEASGKIDVTFNPGADGPVLALAAQADGKLVAGGQFLRFGGQARGYLARLNPDGSLDSGFNPGANSTVLALALQADGKLLVGGVFGATGGQNRARLARFNADGTLDAGFNPGADGDVRALAVQPDGRILVGGAFTRLAGVERLRLGRLNANGSIDPDFNPGADDAVNSFALQIDGGVIVTGAFGALGGLERARLARVGADGRVDLHFNPGADASVNALALGTDGRVMAGGGFASLGGGFRNLIGRLNNTGPATESFERDTTRVRWLRGGTAPEGLPTVFEHSAEGVQWTVLGAGTRVTGGWELTGIQVPEGGTVRGRMRVAGGAFNGSTWLGEGFTGAPVWLVRPDSRVNHPGTSATFRAVARGSLPLTYQWSKDGVPLSEGDGVAGTATAELTVEGVDAADAGHYRVEVRNAYGRIASEASLSVNRAFAEGGFANEKRNVVALAKQPDGKLVVGGGSGLERLGPDGSRDGAFDPILNLGVSCLAVEADGRLLVGGDFTRADNQDRQHLLRLDEAGEVDPAFDPSANGLVTSLLIEPDGPIVIGGEFTRVAGQDRGRLARLNPDGTLESTFRPEADAPVYALARQPDGKILVGGEFTRVGGQDRRHLARLRADGSLDLAFQTEANANVVALAVQPDGRILVGGAFTRLAGTDRSRIARLLPDGTLDPDFDPGADGDVQSLALQADGSVLVAGAFTRLAGVPRQRIGRIWGDGTPDLHFAPEGDGTVYAMLLEGDGRCVVGGGFSQFAGAACRGLARLNNTAPALDRLEIGPQRVTWLRGGTAPEIQDPQLDHSPDGVAWVPLGTGVRVAGGWEWAAINPPADGTFRARGRIATGYANGSSWLLANYLGVPVGVSQPADRIADAGSTVTFDVVVRGTEPFQFQWLRGAVPLVDGGQISGAATATLTLGGVREADEGEYRVVVSNAEGAFTSRPAHLTVHDPVITGSPAHVNTVPGGDATFTVAAVGTPPFQYRWFRDTTPLEDAHGPSLTLSQVQPSDAGSYTVQVSRGAEHVTSTPAALTVNLVTADEGFTAHYERSVLALVPQPDGRILVAGDFTSLGGAPQVRIGRLNPNGTPDATFLSPRPDGAVQCLAVQADGRIVAGGAFENWGVSTRPRIARLGPDGALDPGFNPGANGDVQALEMDAEGRLLVGGAFTVFGGEPRLRLARLLAEEAGGGLDPTFHPQINATVSSILVQPDGRILVGGSFWTVDGLARYRLARLLPDGRVDEGFDAGPFSPTPDCLALQPDGRILATFQGGLIRRLLTDGAEDPAFAPRSATFRTPDWNSGGSVHFLAVQADGRIILAGSFNDLGSSIESQSGLPRLGVARLHPDGGVDLLFSPTVNGSAYAQQADGRLLFAGTPLRRLNTGPATAVLGYDGSTLSWERGEASPEVAAVRFEHSADGTLWSPLGAGVRTPSGWELTDLHLPATGRVRARGFVHGGHRNGSVGLLETVAAADEIGREGPDLIVRQLDAPAQAFAGSALPIAWLLHNRGRQPATGHWVERLFLSSDSVVGDDRLVAEFSQDGPLAPDESRETRQIFVLPGDLEVDRNYWWIVVTDAAGAVAETGEANNHRVAPAPMRLLPSPAPNLQPFEVAVSAEPRSGQPVIVTWSVRNAGTWSTGAGPWLDAVHLSTDDLLDESDLPLGAVARVRSLGRGESYSGRLEGLVPQGLAGSWRFLVTADAGRHVDEGASEQDNTVASTPVVVTLTPPPDLRVGGIQAPAEAVSGSAIPVGWTVTNLGPGPTAEPAWTDRLFLSPSPVLGPEAVPLGTMARQGTLDAGASYTVSGEFRVPRGASGPHFLLVETDAGGEVFESGGEENNLAAAPILLNPPPPSDLAVTEVAAPAAALAGRPITVTYTVVNPGVGATPETGWEDRCYLVLNPADAVLDPAGGHGVVFLGRLRRVGALLPGEGYSGSFTVPLPDGLEGIWYAVIQTDAEAETSDFNPANNRRAPETSTRVDSRPADLVVSGFDTPAFAETGLAFPATWSVRNQGTGEPSVDRWTDVLVWSADRIPGNADDQVLLTEERLGPLAPAAAYTAVDRLVRLPASVPAGEGWLFALTDYSQAVFEGPREANNASAPRPVSVTRRTPDLRVVALAHALAEGGNGSGGGGYRTGDPVKIEWRVENVGSAAPDAPAWTDSVYFSPRAVLDDAAIRVATVRLRRDLEPATAYTAEFIVPIPLDLAGAYFVHVVADAESEVVDDQRSNNSFALPNPLTIAPRPAPDLEVGEVEAPAEAFSGQPASFSWTVRNAGSAEAAGEWFDRVYLSPDAVFDAEADVFLGFVTRPGALAPGASYTRSQEFSVPPGLSGWFYAFVACDSTGRVSEDGDRAGNVARSSALVSVGLHPPTDLAPEALTGPTEAEVGRDLEATYILRNVGSHPALGLWTDDLYLSADDRWDPGDTWFARVGQAGVLAAGESRSTRVTAPTPGLLPGLYRVIVRADTLQQVSDTDRANNLRVGDPLVSVRMPELVLGQPLVGELSPGQPIHRRIEATAGQTLRLRWHTEAAGMSAELLVARGRIPDRTDFDYGSYRPFERDLELVVPVTETGTLYVLAQSVYGTGLVQLVAEPLPLSILTVSPSSAGNRGLVTLLVRGAQFESGMAFTLAGPGEERLAARPVVVVDQRTAFATFDTAGATPGLYGLEGILPGSPPVQATRAGALTLSEGRGPEVFVDYEVEPLLRGGRPSPLFLTYANVGDQDTSAPLILLHSHNAMPVDFAADAHRLEGVQVLGLGSDDRIDRLRQGVPQRVPLWITPAAAGGPIGLSVRAILAEDHTEIPEAEWDHLEASARPSSVDRATWEVFWKRFRARVGSTWGQYVQALNRIAVALQPAGLARRDVRALFEALPGVRPEYLPSCILSGRVLDSLQGTPLAGMTLHAALREDGRYRIAGTDTTDAQGRFAFRLIQPGTYFLDAEGAQLDLDRDGTPDETSKGWTIPVDTDWTGAEVFVRPASNGEPTPLDESDAAFARDAGGITHMVWKRGALVWHAWRDGTEWVDAHALDEVPGDAPVFAAAPNLIDGRDPGLVAVWVRGHGNGADLVYAIGRPREPRGFEWSRPMPLTADAVADEAPAVSVDAAGRMVVVVLKRDVSIRDDTDLYYLRMPVGSETLVRATRTGRAALADGGSTYAFSHEFSARTVLGLELQEAVEATLQSRLTGCTASMAAQAKASVGVKVPGVGDFGFEGNGTLTGEWGADRASCSWDFTRAQLDGAIAGEFTWPNGLVQVLPILPLGGAAATGYRAAVVALHRTTGIRLANGIAFGFGIKVEDATWTQQPPFPLWSFPDSVAKWVLEFKAAPFVEATRLSTPDVEFRLAGEISGKYELWPERGWGERSGQVELTARIRGFVFRQTFPEPTTPLALAGRRPASGAPGTLPMTYDPAAALGTPNIYGPNPVRADVALDLYRDGAPVLLRHANGGLRLLWSREEDPAGPDDCRLYEADLAAESWSVPASLPDSGGLHRALAAVLDPQDRELAVWSTGDGRSLGPDSTFAELQAIRDASDLFWSVREAGGWTPPVRLAATPGPDSEVALARTAQGTVFCAWTFLDATDRMRLMTAAWDGRQWTAPAELVSGDPSAPTLVDLPDGPAVVWTQGTRSPTRDDRVGLFASRWVQGTWTSAEPWTVSPPAARAARPLARASHDAPRGDSAGFLPNVPEECCRCPEIRFVTVGSGEEIADVGFDLRTCTATTYREPRIVRSMDPNDILGPTGYGAESWIPADLTLPYTIRFENDPKKAEVPAQTVIVRQQLDPHLDFTTFRLGPVGFGSTLVDIPEGRAFYQTRIDVVPSLGIYVDLTAGVDLATGQAWWEFVSIDPTTGDLPWDVFAGFLPPNTDGTRGQGFVRYTIQPQPGVSTAEIVHAEARIYFDYNEPIDTPRIFHTLDAEAPSSSVLPLPESVERPVFTVRWRGRDASGAGVASFDVYAAEDEGPWELWLANTPLRQQEYLGRRGHRYRFYCVGHDHVGHREPAPTAAQATTTVSLHGPNQPPIARDDVLGTVRDEPVGVPVAKLLANDRDPEGDSLQFDLPGATSLHGGTLALEGTRLTYRPPPGHLGEDVFYYRLTDGRGGEVLGVVRVEVRPPPGLGMNIVAIDRTGTDQVILRFIGLPGLRYTVQFSPDLIDWTNLESVTARPSGDMDFVDRRSPLPPTGYYRLTYP